MEIIPLGGFGTIGGNSMLIAYGKDAIMVDCGILFPDSAMHDTDYLIPDFRSIDKRKFTLHAALITHAHKDHYAALPHLLEKHKTSICASPLCLAFIKKQLAGRARHFRLITLQPWSAQRFGPFGCIPIPITHSVPQAYAMLISTPIGMILHSGDFKTIQTAKAVDGILSARYSRLVQADPVKILCADSTNALEPETSAPEFEVASNIRSLINNAQGPVFITTFTSHAQRIETILKASRASNRKVVLIGKSMEDGIAIALAQQIFKFPKSGLINLKQSRAHPPEQLTYLVAGSQGERYSALYRLAHEQIPMLNLKPDALFIYSSKVIPGNEDNVNHIFELLTRLGVRIIDNSHQLVHCSGHGYQNELKQLIEHVQPEHFVPMHGETRHLEAHAALARQCGYANEQIHILRAKERLICTSSHKPPLQLSKQADVPQQYISIPMSNG